MFVAKYQLIHGLGRKAAIHNVISI